MVITQTISPDPMTRLICFPVTWLGLGYVLKSGGPALSALRTVAGFIADGPGKFQPQALPPLLYGTS